MRNLRKACVHERDPHRPATLKGLVYPLFVTLFLSACSTREIVSDELYQKGLALIEQGTMLLREGRLDEAEASFSLAGELAPLAEAVDGMGCVALRRGELELAEDLFHEAFEMDRRYDDAAAHLALVLDRQGESEQARDLYLWYLARHPDDPLTRNNMAAFELDRGGRRELTLKEFKRAAAIFPHGPVMRNISFLEQMMRGTGKVNKKR